MAQGPMQVAVYGAANSALLAVSASSVLRSGKARLGRVIVNGTGTASGMASAGALYDAAVTGTAGAAAAKLMVAVPNTVGIYVLDMPAVTGIYAVPSAGAVLAVTLA